MHAPIPVRRLRYIALLLIAAAQGAQAAETPAPTGDVKSLIAALGLEEADKPVREMPGWHAPKTILFAGDPSMAATLQSAAPGTKFIPARAARDTDIAAADAIIGVCSADLIAKARSLRWIHLLTAGVDKCVAVPGLRERNILLTNMQGVQSDLIAEHAITLMLALMRNLDDYFAAQQRATWSRSSEVAGATRSVKGKTLLIVGLGGIGMEVAKTAHALGMKITAIRASGRKGPEFVSYVGLPEELLTLAKDADVVINAAPLTPATTHIFDAKFFAALKPNAYFVNVGRGRSVVTADLNAALKENRLAGAGLDVTDPEPLPAGDPLWRAPNVIITPHVAGMSDLPSDKQFAVVKENLRRYVNGERMLSVVDIKLGY